MDPLKKKEDARGEMLKTSAYGLGFQHLPRDLANVNAWKSMFDPYIINVSCPLAWGSVIANRPFLIINVPQ